MKIRCSFFLSQSHKICSSRIENPQIGLNLWVFYFYSFGTIMVVNDFFCSSVGSFNLPLFTSSFMQCKMNQPSEKKVYCSPNFCILCRCFGVSFRTALMKDSFIVFNLAQCLSLIRSPIASSSFLIWRFSSQTTCETN